MSKPFFGLFHRDKAGNETPIVLDDMTDQGAPMASATATLIEPATPRHGSRVESNPLADQVAALTEQLAAAKRERETEKTQRAAEKQQAAINAVNATAATNAAKAVAERKVLPAGKAHLTTLHTFLGLSAAGLPTDGIDATTALSAFLAALPSHNLTNEFIGSPPPENAIVLENGGGSYDPVKAAREQNEKYLGPRKN